MSGAHLSNTSSAEQLDEADDHRQHQQDVDDRARNVEYDDAEEPQHEQDEGNGEKHDRAFFLFGFAALTGLLGGKFPFHY